MNVKYVCILIMCMTAGLTASANPFRAGEGLGEMTEIGGGRSTATGGAGVARPDGGTLMLNNPALTSGVTSPTLFVGAGYNRSTTYTGGFGGTDSPTTARLNPNVFRLFLPPTRFLVIGWSISPLTKTDSTVEFPSDSDGITDTFTSTGGLSASAASVGINIRDMVRVGMSFNYTFGVIRENWTRSFADSLANNSTHVVTKNYKGYSTSFGAIARVPGGFSIGGGFTNACDMDVSFNIREGASTDLPETSLPKATRKLPTQWTIGVTSPMYRRMTFSLDYSAASWEKAAVTDDEKLLYNDTYTIKSGVCFLPGPRPELARSYRQRMTFYAGVRYGSTFRKSYPKIGTVTEKAVSLGAEFPFGSGNGGVLTTLEFGTRGDKDTNGWDETFTTLNILLIGVIK